MEIPRRLHDCVAADLLRKMVLIAGPRQCGKTILAKGVTPLKDTAYLNWDIARDRKAMQALQIPVDKKFLIFDELHKFRRWKNWLKGVYDEFHHERHILVTGSARLDIWRKGGDSLQGRYFMHRLHPFTLSEYLQVPDFEYLANWGDEFPTATTSDNASLRELLELGGFPEPLCSQSKRAADRWRLGYGSRLIQEDVRNTEQILEIDLLERLYDRLPEVAGGPLSIKNISDSLEVSHPTLSKWIELLERMYVCFRVPPLGSARNNTINKTPKLYLWDWARIESDGRRLENLVGFHLLRWIHWCEDIYGERLGLRYFRDTDGREVDFVILRKNRPWVAIEVKSSEQSCERGLLYFLKRHEVKHAFQLHLKGTRDYWGPTIGKIRIRCMPVAAFLRTLP